MSYLNVVNVFSDIDGIEDVYRAYKAYEQKPINFARSYTSTTFRAQEFPKVLLESDKNAVVFWRELPSWLPVKTKAKIGLSITEDVHLGGMFCDNKVPLGAIANMCNRADFVTVRDNIQRNNVREFTHKRVIIQPALYYDPTVHGPMFPILFPKSSYRILVLGDKEKRATMIVERLSKRFQVFAHLHLKDKGQMNYLRKSDVVIALVPETYKEWHVVSAPYTLMTRCGAAGATLICEFQLPDISGNDFFRRTTSEYTAEDYISELERAIFGGQYRVFSKNLRAQVERYDPIDNLSNSVPLVVEEFKF